MPFHTTDRRVIECWNNMQPHIRAIDYQLSLIDGDDDAKRFILDAIAQTCANGTAVGCRFDNGSAGRAPDVSRTHYNHGTSVHDHNGDAA